MYQVTQDVVGGFDPRVCEICSQRCCSGTCFFFSHPDFDDGEFYAAKQYIHVVQGGDEEYLFDVPVPSVRRVRQYVSARVNKERVEGENIATDLPSILSGQRVNLNNDDMNKL